MAERRERSRRARPAGPVGRHTPYQPAEPADAADPDAGPPADPESVARAIALRLLTARARTRSELAEAMARRRVPPDVAARVLDRFAAVGLVDDAAFAAAWVESRQQGRGRSRRALAVELRRRGVAADVAAEALGRVQPDDETAAARALLARRLPGLRGVPSPVRDRRLLAMLARRGYSADLARRALAEAVAGEPDRSGPSDDDEAGLAGADQGLVGWPAEGEQI